MAQKTSTAKLHLLSTREVQNAPDGDHSDGGGLLLRVRSARLAKSSGKPLPATESWVFRYTSPAGARREMGLGVARRGSAAQAGDSLAAARELAHEARGLVKRGSDPIDERDGRRGAERQATETKKAEQTRERLTLARWARDYHKRIEHKLTTKHGMDWIQSLENHVPSALWHAPIASISAPVLLKALESVHSVEDPKLRVPETLSRVRQRLDAVFEDAIFHGHCATNPAAAIRRKMRETLPAKKAGEFRALDYRDVPSFMAKLRSGQGVAPRCLEFALLTASRTNEVLFAAWSEFDLDAALWVIPGDRMPI